MNFGGENSTLPIFLRKWNFVYEIIIFLYVCVKREHVQVPLQHVLMGLFNIAFNYLVGTKWHVLYVCGSKKKIPFVRVIVGTNNSLFLILHYSTLIKDI